MPPISITVPSEKWIRVFTPGDRAIQLHQATLMTPGLEGEDVCLQARIWGEHTDRQEWTVARAHQRGPSQKLDLRFSVEHLELRAWTPSGPKSGATWAVCAMLSPLLGDEELG